MINKALAKSIGTAARRARKSLNLTQEGAAERIKVSVEFYARIERGRSLPSVKTLVRIVDGLGVSADELLGRIEVEDDTAPITAVVSARAPVQMAPAPAQAAPMQAAPAQAAPAQASPVQAVPAAPEPLVAVSGSGH